YQAACLHALPLNQAKDLHRIKPLDHDVGGAHESERVGHAPAVGVKQRDGVQLHCVFGSAEAQRHVHSMEIDIPVRQHHALGMGAGSAGVEQLRQRILIELHHV